MWGSTVLEVLIGLVVVYLTLSLVCSAASEGLAQALTWRGTTLRDAVARLMSEEAPSTKGYMARLKERGLDEIKRFLRQRNDDPWSGTRTKLIYSHPLVTALTKESERDPSYLPAEVFADVLLDRLAPAQVFSSPSARALRIAAKLRPVVGAPPLALSPGAGEVDLGDRVEAPKDLPPDKAAAFVKAEQQRRAELVTSLRSLFDHAQTKTTDAGAELLAAFKTEIIAWYERTMARTTGWYRRKTQKWLFVLALIVVVATNADTIEIVQQLARNPALRDSLNAAAQAAVESNKAQQELALVPAKAGPDDPKKSAAEREAEKAREQTEALAQRRADDAERNKKLAEQLSKAVEESGLELGWTADDVTELRTAVGADSDSTVLGWIWGFLKSFFTCSPIDWRFLVRRFFGLLVTTFAVALGAPFWFQMLEKLVKLRAAGANPSAPAAASDAPPATSSPSADGNAPKSGAAASTTPPAPTSAAPEPTIDWPRTAKLVKAAALPKNQAQGELPLALFAARLSALAYEPGWRAEQIAAEMGLLEPKLIDRNDTQALVGVHSSGRVVVAFRGTETSKLRDILADADTMKIAGPFGQSELVHRGFSAALAQVFADVAKYVDDHKADRTVLITGHSLGAALATLFVAHHLKSAGGPQVELITFGSPRVGNAKFRELFDAATGKDANGRKTLALRFVNHRDLVTRVAPRTMEYDHVGDVRYFDERGSLDTSETKWREFLAFVLDASAEFQRAAKGTVADHAIALYVRKLEDRAGTAT